MPCFLWQAESCPNQAFNLPEWSSSGEPNCILGIVQDSSSPVGAIHYPSILSCTLRTPTIFSVSPRHETIICLYMCAISCLIYVPDATDGTPALYFHFSLHCSDLFRTGKIPSYNAPRHRTQPPTRTMYIPTSSLDSKHSETYLNFVLVLVYFKSHQRKVPV